MSESPNQPTTKITGDPSGEQPGEISNRSNNNNNHPQLKCGLKNSGNDCFINATLQCLSVSPFILDYITYYTDDDYKLINCMNRYDLCKYKASELDDKCRTIIEDDELQSTEDLKYLKQIIKQSANIFMYISFKELIKNLYLRRNKIIDPNTFIIVSRELSQSTGFGHLFSGEQNDPHEFLAYILDVVHNAKSSEVSINISANINEYSEVNQLYFKHFKSRYAKDHSLFVRNFYYYIVNCVLCANCGHKSNEVSPNDMICLPLPPNIKKEDSLSILDCFDQLFSVEPLEYKCEKCNNTANNQIEKKILTKPKTLIIKIKRYTNVGTNGNILMKVNKFIAYPDVFNISKYCCVENPNDYELYAVINHVGFLNGGHYYAYVRERIPTEDNKGVFTDNWFLCNDTRVNLMKFEDVLTSSNAYILFYHIKQ